MKRGRLMWRWVAGGLALLAGITYILTGMLAPPGWTWVLSSLQFIGHLAAFASVVALFMAIAQQNDAKMVREALSTKFIGEFPSFLPEVIRVLETARYSITIVCDFPTYGRFSKPESWRPYRHLLEAKSEEGVSISLVCLCSEVRRKVCKAQFIENPGDYETKWPKLRGGKYKDKLRTLLERHKRGDEAKSLTFDQFIDLLESEDLDAERNLIGSPAITTKAAMPLYFWVSDDKVAVFAFPTYSGDKTEFGFLTSDQKLIESFFQVFRSYTITTDASQAE